MVGGSSSNSILMLLNSSVCSRTNRRKVWSSSICGIFRNSFSISTELRFTVCTVPVWVSFVAVSALGWLMFRDKFTTGFPSSFLPSSFLPACWCFWMLDFSITDSFSVMALGLNNMERGSTLDSGILLGSSLSVWNCR